MSRNKLFRPIVLILFLVMSFFLAGSVNNQVSAEKTVTVNAGTGHVDNKPNDSAEDIIKKTGGNTKQSNSENIMKSEDKNPVAKKVYLTFDDGPGRHSTLKILDILDQYKIKGTFFVVGVEIEKNSTILKEIDNRGHYIGNHTYSHNYQKIYKSDLAFIEDLKKNEELIYSSIGKRPKVIRDPGGKLFGKYDSSLHKKLVEQGYERIEWNIDSFDSRSPRPSKEKIVSNVIEQAKKQKYKREIKILLHDTGTHSTTIEALPEIIEYFIKEGYVFTIPK